MTEIAPAPAIVEFAAGRMRWHAFGVREPAYRSAALGEADPWIVRLPGREQALVSGVVTASSRVADYSLERIVVVDALGGHGQRVGDFEIREFLIEQRKDLGLAGREAGGVVPGLGPLARWHGHALVSQALWSVAAAPRSSSTSRASSGEDPSPWDSAVARS